MALPVPSLAPAISSDDDAAKILDILPLPIRSAIEKHRAHDLIEVVLDLGRPPQARFQQTEIDLSSTLITREDLEHVVSHLSPFAADNRSGIEGTLHRISAIRNRTGVIIGLTCRVGRAVQGTADLLLDLIKSGKSILLLGPPGVGKTTLLRECARLLSQEKRVVVVDTSNEIAGDSDIPHVGIGRARRMPVPDPLQQHAVMIEAVENHMPQVVVIDEIGTEAEALAARTIAERGVQLIATAHGKTLENLMSNPTLSDLVGGITAVTLSDEEARRRNTRKTVLERKAPPTFEVLVEIRERQHYAIHGDLATTVDSILRGYEPRPEIRKRVDGDDGPAVIEPGEEIAAYDQFAPSTAHSKPLLIFPYGISRNKIERAIRALDVHATVCQRPDDADVVLMIKRFEQKSSSKVISLAEQNIPIMTLKTNTVPQIERALRSVFGLDDEVEGDDEMRAMQEAELAIARVIANRQPVELAPAEAHVRRKQHQLADDNGISSHSVGKEPNRRIRYFIGLDG